MPDSLFLSENVPLSVLKKRAYNGRWASVEEGIIPLTAADPDFCCAPEIVDAVQEYVSKGVFSYGPPEGLPEFRESASQFLKRQKNITIDPDLILPVNSAAAGMYLMAKLLLNPGDEVIILDPVDFLFKKTVEEAGGVPITIPVDLKTAAIDFDKLKKSITAKTKFIGFCNPHNPLGRIYNEKQMLELAEIAETYNLYIMSDEIWSDIIYPPSSYKSFCTINSAIAQRVVTVYGYSKTFALAGFRIGIIFTHNRELFKKLFDASMMMWTIDGVSTVSQIAARAAMDKAWYWVEAFKLHLQKMRDVTVSEFNKIDGIHCEKPDACYVAFANITQTGMNSDQCVEFIKEKAKVSLVPGSARWFGSGAEGHIRLCYATSEDILNEAFNRIRIAFKN